MGSDIKLSVVHKLKSYPVHISEGATFGDLKRVVAGPSSLQPGEQKLLFRGRERADGDRLLEAGVRDGAKVMLVEDQSARERKAAAMQEDESMEKARKAVATVREEVDKLEAQAKEIEGALSRGEAVPEKELGIMSELLTQKLLKLDGIEATGEARQERKAEVQRVARLAERVDRLKAGDFRDPPPSTPPQASLPPITTPSPQIAPPPVNLPPVNPTPVDPPHTTAQTRDNSPSRAPLQRQRSAGFAFKFPAPPKRNEEPVPQQRVGSLPVPSAPHSSDGASSQPPQPSVSPSPQPSAPLPETQTTEHPEAEQASPSESQPQPVLPPVPRPIVPYDPTAAVVESLSSLRVDHAAAPVIAHPTAPPKVSRAPPVQSLSGKWGTARPTAPRQVSPLQQPSLSNLADVAFSRFTSPQQSSGSSAQERQPTATSTAAATGGVIKPEATAKGKATAGVEQPASKPQATNPAAQVAPPKATRPQATPLATQPGPQATASATTATLPAATVLQATQPRPKDTSQGPQATLSPAQADTPQGTPTSPPVQPSKEESPASTPKRKSSPFNFAKAITGSPRARPARPPHTEEYPQVAAPLSPAEVPQPPPQKPSPPQSRPQPSARPVFQPVIHPAVVHPPSPPLPVAPPQVPSYAAPPPTLHIPPPWALAQSGYQPPQMGPYANPAPPWQQPQYQQSQYQQSQYQQQPPYNTPPMPYASSAFPYPTALPGQPPASLLYSVTETHVGGMYATEVGAGSLPVPGGALLQGTYQEVGVASVHSGAGVGTGVYQRGQGAIFSRPGSRWAAPPDGAASSDASGAQKPDSWVSFG